MHPDHHALAKAFRPAGALSPASAPALQEIPGVDTAAVVALAARAIAREAGPGLHYMSASAAERHVSFGTRTLEAPFTTMWTMYTTPQPRASSGSAPS